MNVYEVKPFKLIGATTWAVYKNGHLFISGLTREQAAIKKENLEKKDAKIQNRRKILSYCSSN